MANVWENAVITNKGIALQAKMLAGGKSVKITSVKSGSGSVQSAALMNQENVSGIRQTLTLKPLQKLDKTVIITAMLTNAGVTSAYDLRQVGFYAEDPDEGEILYMIAQNTEARHIPTEEEIPGYSLVWNFHLTLSNGVNIEVNVDPAGYVTEGNLEARLSRLDIATLTGETIVATDSLEAPLYGLSLFGKSKQATTTGAQLLNTSNCEIGGYNTSDGTPIFSNNSYRFNDAIAVKAGETLYFLKKLVIMEFSADGSFIRQNASVDLVYTVPSNVATIKLRTYIADFETFCKENYMISRTPIDKWEEYSGGMPSPSPEYQQDITSIESTKISMYGKNILKNLTSAQTFNGITYTPHGNGGIKVDGTATSSAALVLEYKTAVIGEYILSGSTTNTRVVARVVYKDGTSVYHTSYNGSIVEFELTEDVREYNVYVEVKGGITTENEYMHPMLRMKLAPNSDWESYKTLQSITLPYVLRGIPVDSDGNYTDQNGQQWICDEVDLEHGTYIQRISDRFYLKDFTNWAESTAGENYVQYIAKANDAFTFENCLNNTFQMITVDERDKKSGIVKYPDNHLRVSFVNSFGLSSLEAVVAWLEEVGAYVHYIFSEPIVTPLTEEEIKAYKAFYSNHPVSTFMNFSGAGMMVKYATSEIGVRVSEIAERVDVLNNRPVNNNLLINSNFANPVNQRKKISKASGEFAKYFIDRWRVYQYVEANVRDGYIELVRGVDDDSDINVSMAQPVDAPLFGKTVTFSVKLYDNDDVLKLTTTIPKTYSVDDHVKLAETPSYKYDTKLMFYLINGVIRVTIKPKTQKTIKVEWAKLEYGEVATPYVPRLYREEFDLCERYYQTFNIATAVFVMRDNNRLAFRRDHRLKPRIVPTPLWGENLIKPVVYKNGTPVENASEWTFEFGEVDRGYTVIYANKENHGLTYADYISLKGDMAIDAEL